MSEQSGPKRRLSWFLYSMSSATAIAGGACVAGEAGNNRARAGIYVRQRQSQKRRNTHTTILSRFPFRADTRGLYPAIPCAYLGDMFFLSPGYITTIYNPASRHKRQNAPNM